MKNVLLLHYIKTKKGLNRNLEKVGLPIKLKEKKERLIVNFRSFTHVMSIHYA